MDKKKVVGVKFQDNPEPVIVQKQNNYKSAAEQRDLALKQFNKVQTHFKVCIATDPQCRRKDTAASVQSLLNNLKESMQMLNIGTFDDKNQNYYLLYNATIYMFDMCRVLRKSVYQYMAIDYIAFCITSMEGCLTLLSIKYLDWRIKLYIELAHIYHSLQSVSCSQRTIEMALQKVQELRDLEEVDPPLPDYIDKILKQNTRLLRILEIKFKVQSGALNVDGWRKKIEEYFSQDKEAKVLSIIESLRYSPPNQSNSLKQAPTGVKEQLVQIGYEIIKADMDKITQALEQQMDKIGRTVEIRQKNVLDELERSEVTKKRREYEATLIKEKEWRLSAEGLPLEYQIELAQHAFEVNNIKVFDEISNSAYVRCKYRRIEVPYIQDVNILIATNPYPNIPNGYDKINIDINEANLRNELRKLRNKNKNNQNEQQQPKKDDKKDKEKDKKQQEPEKPVVDQIGYGVQATEGELSQITHNYVYLVYKKSMTPDNAIYDIDVVMAHEEEGPKDKLAEGYRAIAIPIKQYTGVREKFKMIPYLLLKHTNNELADERQKMTLLVDIKPLFGKNPLIRPDPGFYKIGCDLRQVPKEFIRSPAMDYLFITYKNDKYFSIKEREIQILIHYVQLEKTYQKEISTSIEDDTRLELDICYDLNSLSRLIKMINSCLVGPLGQQFLNEKKDFLNQLSFLIWKKYIMPPLYQFQFINEQLVTLEMSRQDFQRYDKWIQMSKQIYKEGLLVLNEILFKIPYCDIIQLCKMNLSLAKFLEEDKEPGLAVDNLNICLDKIVKYRNDNLSRGVNSSKDLFLPFSITCSNRKIQEMVQQMRESYITNKNILNREIRIKDRSNLKKAQLDDDELLEEEYEMLEAQISLLREENKDPHQINTQIYELDLLINSLHADVMITLFRCLVSQGAELRKKQTKKQSIEDGVDGVSIQIQKKMSIMQQETAQTIKKNLNQLQTTLQKEGKIQPPKPLIHDFEQQIIQQANKNPYANCLLYIVLAQNKIKQTEQTSLLQESLQYLKEAELEEQQHIQNGIQDAIFVMSTLCDNLDNSNWSQVFPYKTLYDPTYIKSAQVPRKPILISRNSESVTFKLPPFKPKLLDMIAIEQNKKTITSMAIFGKVSANGVNVSLTCNDLTNTGTRQKIGGVVTIPGLKKNDKYCFAVAAYDATENVSNGIGETSDDISLLHPLPLPQLASYLCKSAYQLSNYEICEEAADICINEFTEESLFTDRQLSNEKNPIFVRRLIQNRVSKVSLIEVQCLTETLLIKSKCLQRQITNTGTPAQKHMQLLRICNFLLLSLETCLSSRSFSLAKRIVAELYNMLEQFQYEKPIQVFHLLLKSQIVIVEIPKQYWDANLRIVSAKITYEILKYSMKINEISLGRRVIFSALQGFNRKWYQVAKMITVEVQEEKGGKDIKKDNKKATKQEEPAQPPKLVPKLIRELFEQPSLQDYLEETMLSMHEDFGDYVTNFIEKWKESIDQLIPFVENPQDQLDRNLTDLSIKLEFWDQFKDLQTAPQKINKQSPIYLEMLCKLIRRMIQSNFDFKVIIQLTQFNEPFSPSLQIAQDLLNIQLQCINNDIEYYPALLPELIQDKQTNKVGNDVAIELFTQYNQKKEQLIDALKAEGQLKLKQKKFENQSLWRSELSFLKAILSQKGQRIRYLSECYISVQQLDIEHFKELIIENEGFKRQIEQKEQQKEQQKVVVQPVPAKPGQKVQQPVVQQELTEEEELLQITTNIFKNISEACVFATQSKQYIVLINQIKFLYNFLLKEQISPFSHKGQSWQELTLISNCINIMIREIKQYGLFQVKEQFQLELSLQPHLPNSEIIFIPPLPNTEPIRPALLQQLSKDQWFTKFKDMDLLANIQAYIIQVLMMEQKWNSLIGISREFCNLTTHYYSQYILPFTIHAQTILYNQASQATTERIEQLNQRTQAFQLWEQTKKKKNRSAMLTQEVPQEEIDYKNDKQLLEQQIALLQSKQDFIQGQLKISERLISEINRDANQAIEGLKQARKLYEKFAQDEEQLFKEQLQLDQQLEQAQIKQLMGDKAKIMSDNNLKIKRKNHKQYGMQVVSKYKYTIELLQKRQEKFATVLALKELAQLNYALQVYPNAEESWNDSLDTIFQQIHTMRDKQNYRKIINDCQTNNVLLAQQYGVQQCLIAINLCSSLAYNIYYNNCYMQSECGIFASELMSSILKMQIVNGQDWAAFINTKEISIGNLFNDRYTLDPAELALSCERLSWILIDRDEGLRSIPLISVLIELSNRLQSNFYSVRGKLLKSLALSQIGYINQSYQCLVQVAGEKDLPDQNQSLWQQKMNGKWWASNIEWNNSVPPYDEKHVQLSEQIIKDLQLTKAFGIKYGVSNENLFNFALSQLMSTIHQGDIVEKWEINETRCKILQKVELQIRQLLKKLNFEEQFEIQIQSKSKEEVQQFAKQNGVEQDFENLYNLLYNQKPVGATNNQENLTYNQKREERLQMMARCRNLMAKVNLSMGLITRSLFIYKYAIENMVGYFLEAQTNENGEEPENPPLDTLKPQGMIEDKKGAKKGAEKETKKAGKETKQEIVDDGKKSEQQQKLDAIMNAIVIQRRARRTSDVFWWNKLRTDLFILLYKHNRFQEAINLAESLQADLKASNDKFHLRLLTEFSARIQFKDGQMTAQKDPKIKPKAIQLFRDAIDMAEQYHQKDPQLVQLYGDYGEILIDRGEYHEAKQFFYEAYKITEEYMKNFNYGYGVIPNWNQKAAQEVKVCQDLCVPLEIEQEIIKKTDKNIKQSKKDDKKGKDDGKVVKKGADKDKKKETTEKPAMPIKPLNQPPGFNFSQQGKLTYTNLDIDLINNTQYQYNCYLKYVDLWQRAALRYVDIMLLLNLEKENSTVSIDSQESSFQSEEQDQSMDNKKFDIQEIQIILSKLDTSIQKSINVPISFKLELFYLQSKVYKSKFVQILLDLQQKYMQKYIGQRIKKYSEFFEKRPYRDLVRNKYFLSIPPYCQILKESGLQLLQLAKESLKKAISVIRGEAILFEYNRKPEDILTLMVEICLLQREYRNRVGYKHFSVETLQQMQKQDESNIEQTLQGQEKDDKLEQLNLELEAQTYIKYSIDLVKARQELCENFAQIALNQIQDISKLSYDIFTEIIEQDYLYKKQYQPMLFDEQKKKQGVSSIDILLYMQKIWRESQNLTFTTPQLQKMISKAHRFLKLQMQSYQKCLVSSIEVAPKNDINTIFVDEGSVSVKSIYDRVQKEYKFIYVLGIVNKDKIISQLTKEEKEKLLLDEKIVYYGNIYVSDGNLSILLQDCLDLQSKMQESDKQPAKFKERDYKKYNRQFYKIIESFGQYFFLKPVNLNKRQSMEGDQQIDILEKYSAIVPELTHENILFLINIGHQPQLSGNNEIFPSVEIQMNYKQIIQDILVLYFDPYSPDFVLRKDFVKPHLAQKYYQCLKLGLEELSSICLQLIQSKLLKLEMDFKISKLHLEYWKIFNSLPQPKDELVSFIIIVIWFIIHCCLYKSYSIEDRQKFDQRFMLDEYHVLIFYLNGFFVSDDFVKIQIETYMSPHYLNYRLNSYQKKNQKKQTSQTNIFPNISVQELSTGGIQLKKDLRNKRKIKKPTETSEQPTEIFTQVSEGGKFPNTIKFNLNQLSPSVTSLLNSHQIKPCFISHKLSNSNGNDINLAKVLQNIQNHRSTSTFERAPNVSKSLKMLDRFKVPMPPADYYKKNPKVDHLFKDMLEMNLILQSNRQHMSTSPRVKDENPSARDRIILLLQEKQIQQQTNRDIQQKLTDDFMSTAFQSRELTNTVNTLLTSRRPSSHIQTEARQTSQKIQTNRFGYEDKRKQYYDKYSKLTEQIPTEAKINHLQHNIQAKQNTVQKSLTRRR